MVNLTKEEWERYSRQVMLDEIGREGQKRLRAARVLVVGAGGLGSPASLYLTAAGIGTLGILDFDTVELSNLQRQILHRTKDVGTAKVISASRTLSELNPHVTVVMHRTRLGVDNVRSIVTDYDIIVSCVDNFASRYLLNDTCVFLQKPLVEAGVLGFTGMITTILPEGPCYRCIFPTPPSAESSAPHNEVGVIGAVPGIMGSLQAMETINLILGGEHNLSGRLLIFDGRTMSFREVSVAKAAGCPVCGNGTRAE